MRHCKLMQKLEINIRFTCSEKSLRSAVTIQLIRKNLLLGLDYLMLQKNCD